MKKTFLLLLGLVLNLSMLTASEDIQGYWKSMNETTGKVESVVVVYPYQGKDYGRIIMTYNPDGTLYDTIDHPLDRAPGLHGHPYFAGLDLIWDLQKHGERYKGKIVDPEKGKIYDSELWVKDGNLIVRGEIFFFGRNQTWLPMSEKEFPSNFQKPDVSKFVPVIPHVASAKELKEESHH